MKLSPETLKIHQLKHTTQKPEGIKLSDDTRRAHETRQACKQIALAALGELGVVLGPEMKQEGIAFILEGIQAESDSRRKAFEKILSSKVAVEEMMD